MFAWLTGKRSINSLDSRAFDSSGRVLEPRSLAVGRLFMYLRRSCR